MKRIIQMLPATLLLFAVGCAATGDFLGDVKDVLTGEDKNKSAYDPAAAILLMPEIVPTVVPGASGSAGGSNNQGPDVHDLFAFPPGTSVQLSRLAGTIDPVGTTLSDDFDGDGILNANETTTSIWVADYPIIETSIAAPVTLKIEILRDKQGNTSEIVSDITAQDTKSATTTGTDWGERSELNTRTVQYQDRLATSAKNAGGFSNEGTVGGGFSATAVGVSVGMSFSTSSSNSLNWSNSNSMDATTTKWKDQPFRNDLKKDNWSQKEDSASRQARKYRTEKNSKVDTNSIVKPDAGYVRAGLYIKNLSVNMPVRLSNILCSLVFETPSGELIPMQSFRLRNADFSLFEVDVYGDSQFGPYVVELKNLNTVEVEKAIEQGYNPKIFIVSYDMKHVPDSNYKSSLLNYSGDNVKIIEENAKGRSAFIKIKGPNLRSGYRVAAFSTTGGTNPCTADGITAVSPGVTLRDVLTRLSCSGVNVQFQDYVIDMSQFLTGTKYPRLHLPTIKSIGGIQSNIPCSEQSHTGSDGVSRTACVMKPFTEWTKEERNNFGMWTVLSDGRYYHHSRFVTDNGSIRTYDGDTPVAGMPMVQGVDSIVWAGDHIELVYITAQEVADSANLFGTNPLENGNPARVNTRWNKKDAGSYPYDPDTKAIYLGQAGLGEKVDITFQLRDTTFLDYNFGSNSAGSGYTFNDFSASTTVYKTGDGQKLFGIYEAVDFEMSLGLGGTPGDWFNVIRGVDASGGTTAENPKSCGVSMDYLRQTFTVCVELPSAHPLVSGDAGVGLYIRPALNSAYRETIWPAPFTQVRKFSGRMAVEVGAGSTEIKVNSAIGTAAAGDVIDIGGIPYNITGTPSETNGVWTITLAAGLVSTSAGGTEVGIAGNLTQSQMSVDISAGFFTAWNGQVFPTLAGDYSSAGNQALRATAFGSYDCGVPGAWTFHPMQCLGFRVDYLTANWAGNDNLGNPNWNAFTDAGDFANFMSVPFTPFLTQGSDTVNINLNDAAGYGMNNFLRAPLIERNYDITARFR